MSDRAKVKAVLRFHDIKTSPLKRYVLDLEKRANGKKTARIMKLREQVDFQKKAMLILAQQRIEYKALLNQIRQAINDKLA